MVSTTGYNSVITILERNEVFKMESTCFFIDYGLVNEETELRNKVWRMQTDWMKGFSPNERIVVLGHINATLG